MIRLALASTGKSRSVADLLPSNYKVIGRTLDNRSTIIVGIDSHGWTLEEYVIPRLASGLIACTEMTEKDGLSLTQLELPFKEEQTL